MKVAFATSDRLTVNQHFGSSSGFAIYGIDATRSKLLGLVEFAATADSAIDTAARPDAPAGGSSHGRLAEKIGTLAGCAAVYCLAVGGAAVRQLLAQGIQPMRLDDETAIDQLLGDLRRSVQAGGVAWIDRAVRREHQPAGVERLARLADEAWDE